MRHHFDRTFAVDACPLGENQALGESEHLHGEADVDRELEHQSLAVLADVGRRAQFAQDRLDPPVFLFVAADMIVSVPDCTCGTLPDTGASSIAAPSSRTRSASSRLALGLTVLKSIQTFPSVRPARIPSGPEATSSRTSSFGTDVIKTSAASAISRGVSRHSSPLWTRSSA